MRESGKKIWTVLIYLNGNNELEPEMWQAKLDAEKAGSNNEVNVLMQIGRENQQLAKIIRPFDALPVAAEQWTGAKRYYVKENCSDTIENLGKINMAHPLSLYDFIKWGANNYPADHHMLILGGHAFQFVGMMTDYSQNAPYIMGIPEMVEALDLFKRDSNNNIDLLVLDTCGMNSVEVICELGRNRNHAVKYALTFIGGGPIAGLPYDKLIYLLQQNSQDGPNIIAKKIIENLQLDLISFEVDFEKLQNIKKAANELAWHLLNNKSEEEASNLEEYINLNHENNKFVNDLNNSLWSIIVHYKRIFQKPSSLIAMPTEKLNHPLAFFYYKLAFAKNNYWNHLLLDIKDSSHFINMNLFLKLKPILLSKEVLFAYIALMNPSLSQEEKQAILKNLIIYKDWHFNKI